LVYFVSIWSFCGHLVYFVAIWYILFPFGMFYGHLLDFLLVLVSCTKKNLATLLVSQKLSLTYLHGLLLFQFCSLWAQYVWINLYSKIFLSHLLQKYS
jgi:hypothetical protein